MAFSKELLRNRGKFTGIVLLLQVVFVVLFAIFVEYDDSANASHDKHSRDINLGGFDPSDNPVSALYPMFQDVHVMMFVGFGFLMTFLKRYGFGSVGLNFLIAAFVIQWATLMSGFLHLHHGKILVNIVSLVSSDFAAAAVLISFGAVLGKTSPLQLITMAFIEIVFFQVNEFIGLNYLKAVDVGGSMFVHVFGAYFGITVARILFKDDVHKSTKEGSVYHSDVFAMVGTVFLWMFWPSFNSALAPGDDQHRAVINTYFALAACCVTAFAVSSALDKHGKFDMVHIQNATLAGGVAVGTSADMMIGIWGAMVIGAVAGTLSVLGYVYITPFLGERHKFHDTCGVNNLHGMPGVLAAIAGACAAAMASVDQYGLSLYQIFPARSPGDNSTALREIQANFSAIIPGDNRSASVQAGFQLAALALTLAIAIVGGIITGFILRLGMCDQPAGDDIFDDKRHWEVPDEEEHVFTRISIGENGKEQQQALLSDKETEARVATSSKGTEMADVHVQSTDEVWRHRTH
ncbi:ammonium transporter Rh type B-like [Lineus longissimus]|uniref:ammonium transporter Rh type B-like n=1 Tax=Lineus longissimus TaxID=88925 RepID=UPI002B4DB450